MILIGSAILLAIGLLILLVQAISIAFSLLKIAYYLIKGALCLVVLIVCVVGLGVQYVLRLVDRWEHRHDPEILPSARLTRQP
jgi:hypothetical protein